MKHLWLISFVALTFFTTKAFPQRVLYPNSFSLTDVQLLDGTFKHACDLNIEKLLAYDTDRLLAPFLKEAGLPQKATSFSNWSDLDGHIAGHYLTALAIHYAATGNQSCKTRMDYVLSELKKCQDAHTASGHAGYLGAIPDGKTMWDQVKTGTINASSFALNNKWVPWYNIHKTYAGLRDAWMYGGDEIAKQMFLDLCDWGLTIITPLTVAQMENMLVTEFGGMNEIYADAYKITDDEKYLTAAKRFAHKTLFNSMAAQIDNMDNMHANTQVPKAVGYQRVAELNPHTATDYNNYVNAAEFFWTTVVNNRSLAFGGNSRREHFPSASACAEYLEEREGPESCNTYNMLKLTEGLFRMNPDAKYADYYERAMFNHILSTQHPQHGGYVYFTPARPRHYRVYSNVNQAMWCCVGTGMENHGKYGEFIYTHTNDSLFVNLFLASQLNWQEKEVTIKQETNFPYEEKTNLTITPKNGATQFSLLIRYPSWVMADCLKIKINNTDYPITNTPASYITINRTWNAGDVVNVELPMPITVEEMPNVPNYIAVMKGPILLAARTGTEDLAGLIGDEDRWAHIASGALLSITDAPFIVGERQEIIQKLNEMEAIEGQPLCFKATHLFNRASDKELVFEPFFQIHDSRYMMYWLSMTEHEYEMVRDEWEETEYNRMLLDSRTIDDVKPNEQQPEVDHSMSTQNSTSGFHNGEGWRDATNGHFSYNMLTNAREDLLLMVRYWGNETGNRTFSILIDEQLLTIENVTNKWNRDDFVNVEYPIPASMLSGKTSVTVRFESVNNNVAGGVFRVRMLTPASGTDLFPLSLQISKCEDILAISEVGTTAGTYPANAVAALEAEIANAVAVKENTASTQNEINTTLETLKTAYQNFFAAVNTENDVVLHFKFAENDAVVDITNNQHVAALKNDATTQNMGNYIVAKLGSGNGYVDMGEKAGEILPNLTNFSISTYIHIDASTSIIGTGNYLWGFSGQLTTTSSSGRYMGFRVNRQRFAISKNGTSNEIAMLETGKAITKGKWVHVFYTQYGSVGRLFIDGELVQENAMYYRPQHLEATTCNFLGRPIGLNSNYLKNTLLYEFKVYNRTLSEPEIKNLADITTQLQLAYDAETAVNKTSLENMQVSGGKSVIKLQNAPIGQSIQIYNTTGQLVEQIVIGQKNTTVKANAGVYVVGEKKVVVK